jgi:hypothetical protein
MIGRELEVEILRLHRAEHWKIGTIALQLRVHHSVVRRVLKLAGVVLPATGRRPSKLDAYKGFIVETLTQYPTLRASRLYAMARAVHPVSFATPPDRSRGHAAAPLVCNSSGLRWS